MVMELTVKRSMALVGGLMRPAQYHPPLSTHWPSKPVCGPDAFQMRVKASAHACATRKSRTVRKFLRRIKLNGIWSQTPSRRGPIPIVADFNLSFRSGRLIR